jgi:hypothetical protein
MVPMQIFDTRENVKRVSHGSPRAAGARCNSCDRVSSMGAEDTDVARKAQIHSRTVMGVKGLEL